MSYKATTWAIGQRGLKPAEKIVLWHLCDRYHPDNGCFPSQATLADDCEISRGGLNRHLEKLEEKELIRREARRDPATNRQLPTRYRLAFEDDFKEPAAAQPCPEIGHGAVSQITTEPCLKIAESRVSDLDTNLVREPVIELSESRDAELFERARKAWPTGAHDSRAKAWKAWEGLAADDRAAAVAEIARYIELGKAQGREHICGLATYLAEEKWKLLPARPKPREPAAARPPVKAPPTPFQRAHPHLYPELFGEAAAPRDDDKSQAA